MGERLQFAYELEHPLVIFVSQMEYGRKIFFF